MTAPAPRPVAPADRSGWRRGVRGVLACAAIVTALAVLAQSRAAGDSGTFSTRSYTLDYSLDGPHWVGTVLVAVVVVFVAAAALLWTARRPLFAMLGVALLVLAVGGCAVAEDARFDWGRLSITELAELSPVKLGSTRAELHQALHSPAGYGTLKLRHGGRLDCDIYVKVPTREEGDTLAFCFRNDRIAKRIRW